MNRHNSFTLTAARGPRIFACAVAVICLQLFVARLALALPSLNPHPHILVGYNDPDGVGAGNNHHHWDPLFPLYPANGVANDITDNSPRASKGGTDVMPNVSFDAYSAWDSAGNQALYRNGDTAAGLNFGHGFMRTTVPYRYEGGVNGVPANAVTDFNAAIVKWETEVSTFFNSVGNAPFGPPLREIGFDFGVGAAEDVNFNGVLDTGANTEDANGNGALDGFTVTWNENGIPGSLAEWYPGQQRLDIDGQRAWFFGGAGNIPAGQIDFFTIMLHEIGHIIGLNHINDGGAGRIMRTDIVTPASAAGTTGVRTPDVGSIFGATALYIQPIPEPATGILVMLAATCVAAIRRRPLAA